MKMPNIELPKSSPESAAQTISLETCPLIFVLPTHLSLEELHDVEELLTRCAAPLTYDIKESEIVLGKVSQKKRTILELRSHGLWTEEIQTTGTNPSVKRRRVSDNLGVLPVNQPQIIDLSQETEDEDGGNSTQASTKSLKPPQTQLEDLSTTAVENSIRVVKLNWLYESIKTNRIMPLCPFTVYYARKVSRLDKEGFQKALSNLSSDGDSLLSSSSKSSAGPKKGVTKGVLERAREDAASKPRSSSPPRFISRDSRSRDGRTATPPKRTPPSLHRETSSEHDLAKQLPPAPDWVRNHVLYACLRSAPLHPPNEKFIDQLLKIKKVRELTQDEIGVRAYSTSIASIAAYPYELQSSAEVQMLPGCESKIASLFSEWKHSDDGSVETANNLDTDPVLKILNHFTNIWGVGAKTARDFYYRNNWQSLDDIVEHGWENLTRVQQIGVKYYEEFQIGMSRKEVKGISDTILEHARRVRPGSEYDGHGIECIIVGGYRRGKKMSGDVDIILTHRNPDETYNLVYDVVASLEEHAWITHTLALHLTNSKRDQQTLPYRGDSDGKQHFDTLDKALVVWQDPHFHDPKIPSMSEEDNALSPEHSGEGDREERGQQDAGSQSEGQPAEGGAAGKGTKQNKKRTPPKAIMPEVRKRNPNLHRRVDILVSPFRTVGCAVLGWTGDTTFERDLRRYARNVHNWKFDSSGVRAREGGGGRPIDLEDGGETWEDRERLVMEKLGVGWRPPTERCSR